MNNKYYESEISVYLKQNIPSKDVYDKLSKFINFSFNNSQELSCLHKQSGFKHYSFSGLYPIEKDNIYKADEIYSFLIRSCDKKIITEIMKCMTNFKNEDFITTNTTLKEWDYKQINYVDNLTPTIITLKNGRRWNKDIDGEEIAKENIFNNLVRKYNSLNKTDFTFKYEDIIKNVKIKSKCAIIINYKNVKFLGYKFRVEFQENNIAQEIANLAVVEGIGEKNSSFGMGFVKPYFKKVKMC